MEKWELENRLEELEAKLEEEQAELEAIEQATDDQDEIDYQNIIIGEIETEIEAVREALEDWDYARGDQMKLNGLHYTDFLE